MGASACLRNAVQRACKQPHSNDECPPTRTWPTEGLPTQPVQLFEHSIAVLPAHTQIHAPHILKILGEPDLICRLHDTTKIAATGVGLGRGQVMLAREETADEKNGGKLRCDKGCGINQRGETARD